MKKPLLLIVLVASTFAAALAQDIPTPTPSPIPRDVPTGTGHHDDIAHVDPEQMLADSVSRMKASFGLTQIGGETYAGVRLQPELHLWKVGVGLDIPLQVNIETRKLRTEEFTGGIETLRMIRYAAFGRKKADPFFIRAGDLYGVTLGFGTLINNYSNSPSFEYRKFGVNWDFSVKHMVGVEGVYSDINGFNLLGVRPYIRPLRLTHIPIVRSIEIGGSFVTDKGTNADTTGYFLKQSGIQAQALDLGVTFLNTGIIKVMGFGQTSQIKKINSDTLTENFTVNSVPYEAGRGTSGGAAARFNIASAFRLDVRLERLWYENHYVPQFFDAIYEINKDEKILMLGTAEAQKGIYGNLGIVVLNRFLINGALLLPDQVSVESPALIQLGLETNLGDKLRVSGHYIKGGLADLADAFTLDQRSLANVTATYQVASFLYVGVDYKWTFAELEDGSIEATDYFRPYFGLSFPLGGGGKDIPDVPR